MIRQFPGLICIPLVFAIGGCASTSGFPERPEAAEDTKAALIEKYFLPKTNILKDYEKTPKEEKKAYRNEVVYGRMAAIDIEYGLFKEAIYEEAVGSNLSIDILGITAGAAGAAVTGAAASRVLSSVSTVISGTGTAMNKNLYYEKTMPALLALMDARRAEVRADILDGLLLSVAIYPLSRAIADLERYLHAGSIPGAISGVVKAAGKVDATVQIRLQALAEREAVLSGEADQLITE